MLKAFKMHLYPGQAEEYRRRHDALWPEMIALIHEYGGSNYSIFHDPESDVLFAVLDIADPEHYAKSAETAICQKWWAYMADIMETYPDKRPVSGDLELLFHLD